MARHGETIMNYTSRDILYYKALACMVLERYDEAEDYFNRRLKRTKEDEVIYIGDAAVQKQYGGMLVKNRQIDDGLKLMYNAAFSNKYNWNYVIGYFKEVSKYRTSAEVLSQVEALYQKNESKDRITAYVIGAFIRSLEVMNLYSSQVTITDRTLFDGMFLDMQKLGHLSNEEEITGKVKKGDAEASAVAILYVISHSNAEMERLLELDQTSKYVLQLLRGNEAKRPKRPHEKIVTSLIKELLLRKDVNLLNKLLDAELLDNLTTAKLLDEFGFDDAAVAYYVEEFKQKPNLSKVALRIATLLKGSGQEEEAQMFINFVNN
jgi:tetratricopeptide (TPR) repeat protein